MKSISLQNRIADQKPGKALTLAEKWMVLRVFQCCLDEQDNFELPRTRDVYQKTSEYTGVSRKVVVEIVKHFKQTGTIPPVAKQGNRTNHSLIDPATTLVRIREFINESHLQGLTCTSKHIQKMLDSEFKITVHLRAINVIFMI
jgi:transposase